MLTHASFLKTGVPLRKGLGITILLVNVFVWFSYTSSIARYLIELSETLTIFYTVSFCSVVISMLIGSLIVDKLLSRRNLLATWTIVGVFSSFLPALLGVSNVMEVTGLSLLFGISFGLGLPAALACVKENTFPENRARFGSIVLLAMLVGMAGSSFLLSSDVLVDSLIAACWRMFGLLAILLIGSERSDANERKLSFLSILRDRSFLLYMVPWISFSLVNYLAMSVGERVYGEQFVTSISLIENVVVGVSALFAGFAADIIGRKRTLIFGFVALGMGYAILGIFPSNFVAWFFYTAADGIAWGVILVMFWFTIWGDLAHEKRSEKYYALGILPYSLTSLLRVTFGPLITSSVSEYAIFSMAAFFLFVAVVPLMYAPETLPEKKIKERELRVYLEKAKKVKEKYV
jgi:MFS family permease